LSVAGAASAAHIPNRAEAGAVMAIELVPLKQFSPRNKKLK
jgi:hypothetical protein